VAAAEILVLEERVEIALDLGGLEIPRRAACHAEALVQQHLGEGQAGEDVDDGLDVGPLGVGACGSVLDALQAEQELVGCASGRPQNSRPLSLRTAPMETPRAS